MEKKGYYFNAEDHIHMLDGQPLIGTSTAMSVLAKPLTWWASGLAVAELGWTNSKKDDKAVPIPDRIAIAGPRFEQIKKLSTEDFLKLLDKAYRAHYTSLNKSADKGTDMHAELEEYTKLMILEHGGAPYELTEYKHLAVQQFAEWAVTNVKRFIASEIHCYSRTHWVGGISDCIAELNDGRIVVIDFKSSKEAYLSQKWQGCGYAIEFEENGGFTSDGQKILEPLKIDAVIIFPFGAKEVKPNFYVDMIGGKEAFLAALTLHKKMPSKDY